MGKGGAVVTSVAAAWFVWVHFVTADQWVFLLDHVNLVIHEAGHPIVALLSERLAVYGGTIFQLAVPLLFALHFHRRRESLGWVASWLWLGASLMNVARYMRDARARRLPLVGGGEHDWAEIFGRWGVLSSDVAIGNLVQLLGLAVIAGAVMWAWRRALAA